MNLNCTVPLDPCSAYKLYQTKRWQQHILYVSIPWHYSSQKSNKNNNLTYRYILLFNYLDEKGSRDLKYRYNKIMLSNCLLRILETYVCKQKDDSNTYCMYLSRDIIHPKTVIIIIIRHSSYYLIIWMKKVREQIREI